MKRFKTESEKRAWSDGWRYAARGVLRRDRPSYLTDAEREAFNVGWDERAEDIAWNHRGELPANPN